MTLILFLGCYRLVEVMATFILHNLDLLFIADGNEWRPSTEPDETVCPRQKQLSQSG